MIIKFNAKELNQKFLIERAKIEADRIFAKSSTRRNRTYDEVLKTVLYGHAAEVFLIEKYGFKDDARIYKDIIDTNNNPVEVKVTEGNYYIPYVLKRANDSKKTSWYKFPDILYVFIGNKITADYELHGKYKWNEKEFVLQDTKIMI